MITVPDTSAIIAASDRNAPESAACRAFLQEAGLEVPDTARRVRRPYASLDLDLADAVNVALAAQYRTDAILTIDRRDFRAMRPSPRTNGSGSSQTLSNQFRSRPGGFGAIYS